MELVTRYHLDRTLGRYKLLGMFYNPNAPKNVTIPYYKMSNENIIIIQGKCTLSHSLGGSTLTIYSGMYRLSLYGDNYPLVENASFGGVNKNASETLTFSLDTWSILQIYTIENFQWEQD